MEQWHFASGEVQRRSFWSRDRTIGGWGGRLAIAVFLENIGSIIDVKNQASAIGIMRKDLAIAIAIAITVTVTVTDAVTVRGFASEAQLRRLPCTSAARRVWCIEIFSTLSHCAEFCYGSAARVSSLGRPIYLVFQDSDMNLSNLEEGLPGGRRRPEKVV